MKNFKSLEKDWELLLKQHSLFPFNEQLEDSSPWVLSRGQNETDPAQGWKLHVSATILSACEVASHVVPKLKKHGVLFKVPKTLRELKKINCGLFYGFSQVGKFITIYPTNPIQAADLAAELHALTVGLTGPSVPYESKYNYLSIVHYRYGAFTSKLEVVVDNKMYPAITNQAGELIIDHRGPDYRHPDWLENPFMKYSDQVETSPVNSSPLCVRVKAYESLSQRGKGGVYRAILLDKFSAQHCILKEGRRDGETEWDGRDGQWRLIHEQHVLSELLRCGLTSIPRVLDQFCVGDNYYLVLEAIEGETLQSMILKKNRRIPFGQRISFGYQIANLMHSIHEAGWAWRDCKPLNLLCKPSGEVVALDFEGASFLNTPDEEPWGTDMYVPPEWATKSSSSKGQDLYALGVTLFQLFQHKIEFDKKWKPIVSDINRRVPKKIKLTISALLGTDLLSRPSAFEVSQVFSEYI